MELAFVKGSSIRRIIIVGRTITFIIPENRFVPIKIDLDKLDSNPEMLANYKDDLEKLKHLQSEEDMVLDITKDFQKSGWRKIR